MRLSGHDLHIDRIQGGSLLIVVIKNVFDHVIPLRDSVESLKAECVISTCTSRVLFLSPVVLKVLRLVRVRDCKLEPMA